MHYCSAWTISRPGDWIRRFKAGHGLAYEIVSGEGKEVDESVVSNWMRSMLPLLIAGYGACSFSGSMWPVVFIISSLRRASASTAMAAKAARKAAASDSFFSAAMPMA